MRRLVLVAFVLTAGMAAALEIPSLADGQWQITGRASATACARGRCVTRRSSVNESFVVDTGEGSAESLVSPLCPGVVPPADSVVGTFEPARNGWLRLRVLDRRALVRFLRQCTGYSTLRLQRLRVRVRVASGGGAFELRESVGFTVVVQGVLVQVSAGGRLFASRTSGLDQGPDSGPVLSQGALAGVVGGALAPAVAAVVAR